MIYLTGGGGADQMPAAGHYLHVVGDAILEKRDFIMYNQRGAAFGEPELKCPGYSALLWELVGQEMTWEERNDRRIDFLLDCQDDLLAEGHNLTKYNSAENAADLNDLRIALGYDRVNIYGTSYGTRFGLNIIRDYPDIVRSAILDSVYPPQIDYYPALPHNALRAFNLVFEGCASQPACNAKYPDLEATFYRTVDALNADPLPMSFGAGRDMLVDGNLFMEAFFLYFYVHEAIPTIPAMIDAASRGDFSESSWAVAAYPDVGFINWGVWWSLQCQEEVAFDTFEHVREAAAELPPQIADYFGMPYEFTLCGAWQSGMADPIENEAVVSEVPTLVFAGHFDPITPPSWGKLITETLSNSYFYEFPANGHGVMRANQCGLEIGLRFINDPTTEPDTSCMDDMKLPTFE